MNEEAKTLLEISKGGIQITPDEYRLLPHKDDIEKGYEGILRINWDIVFLGQIKNIMIAKIKDGETHLSIGKVLII